MHLAHIWHNLLQSPFHMPPVSELRGKWNESIAAPDGICSSAFESPTLGELVSMLVYTCSDIDNMLFKGIAKQCLRSLTQHIEASIDQRIRVENTTKCEWIQASRSAVSGTIWRLPEELHYLLSRLGEQNLMSSRQWVRYNAPGISRRVCLTLERLHFLAYQTKAAAVMEGKPRVPKVSCLSGRG